GILGERRVPACGRRSLARGAAFRGKECRSGDQRTGGGRHMKTIFVMLAALAALSASAQAPQGDATRGKALYMTNLCYTCHGTAGQGGDRGSGPRLAPNVFPWEAFTVAVRRPRESMPRYPVQQVSDKELADIHAYLSSIKPGAKAAEIPLLKE